jgi:hypothetical protein
VVLAGRLEAETRVKGELRPRVRVVGNGSSVNVLAVLGVWNRCVETVAAQVETESYAVSAADFANLFTAESDILAFEQMQWFEQVGARRAGGLGDSRKRKGESGERERETKREASSWLGSKKKERVKLVAA